MQRFEAVVEAAGRGGHLVEIPFDVAAVFGAKRPPVRGTVNGAPFRSTVAVYGGRFLLGLNRELRDAAGGVAVGDIVAVELERDEEERDGRGPGRSAAARSTSTSSPSSSRSRTRISASTCGGSRRRNARRRGSRRVERAAEMLREGVRTPDA